MAYEMKFGRLSFCILFVGLIVVLPALSQEAASLAIKATGPKSTTTNAAAHPLEISSGDLLDVTVFDTPELSGKFRVDDRGAITLPLTGDIFVSGLTATQAGHAIESKFRSSDVMKEPHISITVLEYATQGVNVVGEVKNPGVYPLLGSHDVLDFISAAGGLTPNAGKAVTVTHRLDTEHPVVVLVDGKIGKSNASDVDIRPGDTVMVSHSGIVYVVGDVGKPGGFLIENNDRLTVMQAIALAQGTNHTAALDQATLIRKTSSGRTQIAVPLKKILANKSPDEPLADGDVLFVPVSGAKAALQTIEAILPSAAGAAIYHVP